MKPQTPYLELHQDIKFKDGKSEHQMLDIAFDYDDVSISIEAEKFTIRKFDDIVELKNYLMESLKSVRKYAELEREAKVKE